MTEAASAAETLVQLSGPGVVVVVLVLLLRGDLVTKGQLQGTRDELERWRSIALDAIDLGQAALQRRHEDQQR